MWWYSVGLPNEIILLKILSTSDLLSIFPSGSSIIDLVFEEKLNFNERVKSYFIFEDLFNVKYLLKVGSMLKSKPELFLNLVSK